MSQETNVKGNKLTIEQSNAVQFYFQQRQIVYEMGIDVPSAWETIEPTWNGIFVDKLPNSDGEKETRCVITVNKELIGIATNKITGVRIKLVPDIDYAYRTGNVNITGYGVAMAITTVPVYMDLTEQITNDTSELVGYIEPYSLSTEAVFLEPILEIDYVCEEAEKIFRKEIKILDDITGQVDMVNKEIITTVNSVLPENSVKGLGVSQTFLKGTGDTIYGKDIVLSLNEKFEKNIDTRLSVDYVYTDEKGYKYGFKEYIYRFNNGEKEYLTVDKSDIKISADGVLTYNGETVYSEYKSITGLKAVTEMDEFLDAKLIEQRTDELKQVEEKIQNYGNAVKDFVLMNTDNGLFESFQLTESRVFDKIDDKQMFIPKSEALQYQALKQQYETLTAKSTSNQIVPKEADINMQLISLRSSIYELTLTLRNHIESCQISQENTYDKQKEEAILNCLNNNEIVKEDDYKLLTDSSTYREFIGFATPSMGGAALKVKFRQRNLLLEQYKQLNGEYSKDIVGAVY